MKNVSILVFLVLIVLVLILCSVSYQVRETESALVTRLGKVSRDKVGEPGFYWKLPWPIEKVVKFDSRSQLLKGAMGETTTTGGNTILVESYLVWKIEKPQKYLESVKDKADAVRQLRSYLQEAQNGEVGKHAFSDFVNSDSEKIQLTQIEQSMHESLKAKAMKGLGINVEVVGIRRLGVSKTVTPVVFDRMKEERSRKKEAIISEGEADAQTIKSQADAKATQLLAVVDSYAKTIRGEGDAEAAKYYKMLEAEPEFAMYLQDVETLKEFLKEKSTIILGSEMDLINLLKGIPNLKPMNGPVRPE